MRVRLVTPGLFNHVLRGKCGGGRDLCEDRAIAGVEKVVRSRWARLGNAARKNVWRCARGRRLTQMWRHKYEACGNSRQGGDYY